MAYRWEEIWTEIGRKFVRKAFRVVRGSPAGRGVGAKLRHVEKWLEQANEVAWEHIPAFLPAVLVKKLAAPPPILGGSSNGDDIPSLEIEFLLDRSRVIVQSFH